MYKTTNLRFCIIVVLLLAMCTCFAFADSLDTEEIILTEMDMVIMDADEFADSHDKVVIDTALAEVIASSEDVDFSAMSPTSSFAFVELFPGQCIYGAQLYAITQGDDALGIHATWAGSGVQLKIGLIDEENETIYAVTAVAGNATMLISTENIPSGNYYIAVLSDSANTENVFGAIAYSWRKQPTK